jgi:beclin 1
MQVEWAEINAALGHAALLVDTLASAHHLRFPKHTLHLMGSFTKIAHNDEPKTLLELHGSGSLQLGRIFSGTRFDRALAMFLQCIGALLSHARRTASASLGDAPYRIDDDKIGTADGMLSIRLQFNQDELWTRALKYMLTDLKWLLAWHTQVTAAAAVGTAASPRATHGQAGGGLLPPGPQQR